MSGRERFKKWLKTNAADIYCERMKLLKAVCLALSIRSNTSFRIDPASLKKKSYERNSRGSERGFHIKTHTRLELLK